MADIISLLWHDHPEMTLEWYEGEKLRLTPDALAREIDINYSLSAMGVVYREFKDAHIIRGDFKINPYLPVIRCFDYGKTCCALFAQKDTFNTITFFHEILLENEEDPTNKLGRATQAYSSRFKCQGFRDHDDPAGSSDNYVNSDETSWKVIKKYGIHPTHHISGADNARRRNRVEMTKHLLSQFPEGKPLIRVHENCEGLIDALQGGYRYKMDSKTKEILDVIHEEHPHEDFADTFGIMLVEEYSVENNLKIPKRRVRSANRYTGY